MPFKRPWIPRAAIALAVVVTASAAGCRSTPWRVTTDFEFGSLTEGEARYVERVFDDLELRYQRTRAEPLTYAVSGIDDVRALGRVHSQLRRASERFGLDMPLRGATIRYAGIRASGDVVTQITVRVTPGAAVWIADGASDRDPWRRVPVAADGTWRGTVNTSGVVFRQGGWVYGVARLDEGTRAFRIHVLTNRQERHIGPLPFDPP